MIRKNSVQALLKENGMTQADLARKIGMNPATLSIKLNDKKGEKLSVAEAERISKVLKIDRNKLTDIFFADELA